MYNPAGYAPTSQPTSQPGGAYQPPVSTFQPAPVKSVTMAAPPAKAEGAWNDPPIVKPKKVGNCTSVYLEFAQVVSVLEVQAV